MKNNLKKILMIHGITKSEIARYSGLSIGTINKIVSQQGDVRRTTKYMIINAIVSITNRQYTFEDIFPAISEIKKDPSKFVLKKLEEVFKLSGLPTYTFVEPVEYNKLLVGLRTQGRGVVVEGPSGIGKTTCVMKILNSLDSFNLDKEVQVFSGRKQRDIDSIKALPKKEKTGFVIIDDFHRLSDEIKYDIADLLKQLADEESIESKVIVIGINKAGDSLLKFSPDLSGRIDKIKFEINPDYKIHELVSKGEKALRIKINIKEDIIKEAQGSFHLAQLLCHSTCLEENMLEEQKKLARIDTSIEIIKTRVFSELSDTFMNKTKRFAAGPYLRRGGRAPYFFLLKWLAESEEWSLQIDDIIREYTEHRPSISNIVEKGHLRNHLIKNPNLRDILHYDEQTNILSVEDPKFVYFLRNLLWRKFSKQIGFKSINFKSKYDYALSFAGSDRDVAEAIFEKLSDLEISVFYDKNEQHRILAKNVEDYLAPIYKSEANFVIALLGPDFPKKIWTKFESDQFKERFGENSVIPIWFSNAQPGMFDETTRYGGIYFERDDDFTSQIEKISQVLSKKIDEERKN